MINLKKINLFNIKHIFLNWFLHHCGKLFKTINEINYHLKLKE